MKTILDKLKSHAAWENEKTKAYIDYREGKFKGKREGNACRGEESLGVGNWWEIA